MREDAELERLLRQLQRKTGQNLLIQTEDGQVLASTFSAKESFLRDAAEESVSIQELAERAKVLSLDFTSGRYLLAVRAKDLAKGLIEEAAAAILEDDMEAEFCTRSACGDVLLILAVSSDPAAEESVRLLQSALETEAMTRVRIGISSRFTAAEHLRRAVREAETALLAIHTFSPICGTLAYRSLGISLAALQFPEEGAAAYLYSVLGDTPEAVLEDEELFRTAQALLENGLNSAETARQLYIHRNTLLYRLDKIQRLCGRDLRRFEDAAAFQLAAMIWKKRKAENYNGK